MFNEAFWFFYLVNVAGNIAVICFLIAIVTGVASVVTWAIVFDGDKELKPLAKVLVIIAVSCVTIATLAPNERALYAGACQYVAETAEVDETLLRLKKLIDQKIDEELEE